MKRQIGNYLIYFITVTLSAALLFAVNTLTASEPFERFAQTNEDMRLLIRMITAFVSLVTAFVLSYATSFMLRLRKKEFGIYLTLGMTKKNIQGLFAGETLILSGIALAAGIGVGLLISRLFMVLFCFLLDIPGEMFTYSLKATVLMIGIGALIFLFASFFSMRYLKKAEIKELMSETYEEQGAKRPVFWCVLALARGLFGTLLQKKKTAWQRTNTVILRGLSGRMTTNSVLIGVFAVLLTFSVIASNIYLSAVFVCMALAILAMKTLSSLSEQRRRFEVLYRLGVDSAMQKQTLFRQTAAFFFLPLCLPVLFCAAMGVACGKVYALWGFPETSYLAWIIAVVIGAVMLGSYALYFEVTYRAVCRYVVCEGGWDD